MGKIKSTIGHLPGIRTLLEEKRALSEELAHQHLINSKLEADVKFLTNTVNKLRKDVPQLKFISHQLDNSGAPMVFVDMIIRFSRHYKNIACELHAYPPIDPNKQEYLKKHGVALILHKSKDSTPNYVKNDTIVLNSASHSKVFMEDLIENLNRDIIKQLIWYIHEESPEKFLTKQDAEKIKKLIDEKKVTIFTPADKTARNWGSFLGLKPGIIIIEPYHLGVPEKFYKVRSADEFNKLNFITIGSLGDGRKGQLPILIAFVVFKKQYYEKNPRAYREFKLTLIGVEDDFISSQARKYSSYLGTGVDLLPPLDHRNTLEKIYESNITICNSIMESFPIFVNEGMAMGHPILRNASSGMEEQLIRGKNGYYIDDEFYDLVNNIEKILNISTTSHKVLSDMSKNSNRIALLLNKNSYLQLTKKINEYSGA